MKQIIYTVMFVIPLVVSADVDRELQTGQENVLDPTVKILQNLLKLTNERSETLRQAVKELKHRGKEIKQEEKIESVEEMQADLDALQFKLESIATGVSVEEHRDKGPEKFELQKELENLLQPMIYTLKTVTQDSRRIEQYRQSIEKISRKRDITDTAVANLQRLSEYTENPALHKVLVTMLDRWRKEQASLEDEYSTLDSQLRVALNSKESFLSSTGELFTGFFRSRGVNILFGMIAFFSVFALMRYCFAIYKNIRDRADRTKSSFERLFDLCFLAASFLLAIVATLFTFNLRNDWLLLGLGCLFLIALGWVLIKSIPVMVEQVMLLLNLGSIREGERIVYNGVPWEVKSLNFYTHFVNPQLSGGSMHISIKELSGMVSRPSASNEEWFPSREGDWVQLEDGTIGKVLYQSPEMVQLALFSGSDITYTTENYLGQSPKNLSRNYRIQMVFGIDYQYQLICTSEIQEKMLKRLKTELQELLGEDQLIKVTTDFFSANTSSLDYEYEAYVRGSSAHMYEEVERVLVKSFADSCNAYGWKIPFQQITLHNASKVDSNRSS